MATDLFQSPIRVDGVVSEERLAALLAYGAEYDELDFKSTIDLTNTQGMVELAKDVGAMQVKGGYIVAGIDNRGQLTGGMDGAEVSRFDQANLAPMMLRYLDEPLSLVTNVLDYQGHTVVLICVMPSPTGCAFFGIDGEYPSSGSEGTTTVFRAGEVFWRKATSSIRITREGLDEIIERRVAARRTEWLEERAEIESRLLEELRSAFGGRARTEAPLGAVTFALPPGDVARAGLEIVRSTDNVALEHLFNDARARGRAYIDANDIEDGLAELLDGISCVAAAFLHHSQEEWFARTVQVLVEIYAMAFDDRDAERLGYATRVSPTEKGPLVWLAIIRRVFAIGALAVRREKWSAVAMLATRLPQPLVEFGYDTNWLRHALTMASRAQHFAEGGDVDKIGLLDLARADAARLDCLRPDGIGSEDEALLTSIAQFDILSNVAAIDDARSTEIKVFYTNFARFRQGRVQGIADRLITDPAMRQELFRQGDEELARALHDIGHLATQEGVRYNGFFGWERTPVARFIADHLPPEP